MKKNIEWLKREFDSLFNGKSILTVGKSVIDDILSQLDEQEVLSREWINDNSVYASSDGVTEEYVHVDDLQNLIVPKQENTEEQAWGVIHGKYGDETLQNNIDYVESQGYLVIKKPTIPRFVADFLIGKEDYTLYELLDNEWIYNNHDELARWLYNNDEKRNKEREINLVLAQKYDYQVEKEQKFYVLNENKQLMLKKHEGEVKSVYNSFRGVGENYLTFYQLTEQEIKGYDERYWAFRKPVEELEE